jgi:hypothetical protein
MKLAAFTATALVALSLLSPIARSAETRQCFYIRSIDNYSVADDEKTVYLRVNGTRFFRLDLAQQCTGLSFRDHIALNSIGGTATVCSAIELDLRVRMTPGGVATLCQIADLHAMTPDEVAALPKKLKP